MDKIWKVSLLNSIGTLVYIALVATLMSNAEQIFGKMNDVLGPVTFLLLFTLSALVVGILILGRPIMLYLDGKKKEAVQMLFGSMGWLATFTVIFLVILAVR